MSVRRIVIMLYKYILFTQGLCVVLELHQHSAAEKLTREIQQVGVVEQHDEFLEFSGHDGDVYSSDGQMKWLDGGCPAL